MFTVLMNPRILFTFFSSILPISFWFLQCFFFPINFSLSSLVDKARIELTIELMLLQCYPPVGCIHQTKSRLYLNCNFGNKKIAFKKGQDGNLQLNLSPLFYKCYHVKKTELWLYDQGYQSDFCEFPAVVIVYLFAWKNDRSNLCSIILGLTQTSTT